MSSISNNDILVIGAGQMRTGTRSLKSALEILLQQPCYHMTEVFANRPHAKAWIKATKQGRFTAAEAEVILKDYGAIVDYPGCVFYEDLMGLYPDAKVILTVRDARKWRQSCLNTIFKKQSPLSKLLTWLSIPSEFIELKWRLIEKMFGPGFDMNNEELAVEKFEQWTKKVVQNVPEDKLLIFEASQGWGPLCKFLNKPIPEVDYPFENTTEKI